MSRSTNRRGEGLITFTFFFLSLLLVMLAGYIASHDPLFRAVLKLGWQAELVQAHYYDQITPEEIFNRTWSGMQQAIPFPVELDGGVSSKSLQKPSTDYGLRTISKDENLLIYSIEKESPFFGYLQVNDKLFSIDNQDVFFRFHLNQVLNDLNGDSVQIVYERASDVDSVKVLLTEKNRSGLSRIKRSNDLIYLSIDSFSDRLLENISLSFDTLFDQDCRTIIIDLRDSEGGIELERIDCANFFTEILESVPILILINEQTTDHAEIFAEQMKKENRVFVIGKETLGLALNRENIELYGGVNLIVSKIKYDEITITDVEVDSLTDKIPYKKSMGIKPDIEISDDANGYSPIVSNLLLQGIFFDFVLDQDFTSLPSVEDEKVLYQNFLSYLEQIGFHYDPLNDAVMDLSDENGSDEITAIIKKMKIAEIRKSNKQDTYDQNAIIPILLRTIQDMKLMDDPSLDDLRRMGDPYVKALFLHLNVPDHHDS